MSLLKYGFSSNYIYIFGPAVDGWPPTTKRSILTSYTMPPLCASSPGFLFHMNLMTWQLRCCAAGSSRNAFGANPTSFFRRKGQHHQGKNRIRAPAGGICKLQDVDLNEIWCFVFTLRYTPIWALTMAMDKKLSPSPCFWQRLPFKHVPCFFQFTCWTTWMSQEVRIKG